MASVAPNQQGQSTDSKSRTGKSRFLVLLLRNAIVPKATVHQVPTKDRIEFASSALSWQSTRQYSACRVAAFQLAPLI